MIEQITSTSEGCNYGCPFCFNGKNSFNEFELPEIKCNKVILHDSAFLSRKCVLSDIKKLGSKKVGGLVIYYELTEGINLHNLNPKIAKALKENRFKNLRFGWDDSYSKKSYYRVYDGIKMLLDAGFKANKLMCYILSNYYVTLRENMLKLRALMYHHIPVCNCRYRKFYLDHKVYPEAWSQCEIDYYKQQCREHNQTIKFNGFDPEIEKRVIRTIKIPINELRDAK